MLSLEVATDAEVHEAIRAEGFQPDPAPLSLSQPNSSSSLPLPAPAPAAAFPMVGGGQPSSSAFSMVGGGQPSSAFPMVGRGPSDDQWSELNNKVKKGEAVLQTGLKQLDSSTDVCNSVVQEQGQKLKECLLQLDTLLAASRRSNWFRIHDGGFTMDLIDGKIAELADVSIKADALTKMVKNLAASLRTEKQ